MEELKKLRAEMSAMKAYYDSIIHLMDAEIAQLKKPGMVYNYIDDNMPGWAHEGVQYCIDKGIIKGTGEGLGLDDKDLKYCTMLMRVMTK